MLPGESTLRDQYPFQLLFDQRPGYADALEDVWKALWAQEVVDVATLELCRLRIGQLLDAHPVAERVDPQWLVALPHWPTDVRFTARLRVALGYAEQLLMDAQGVGDDQAEEVIAAFGEDGFLVLTYACGLFETVQRAGLLIDPVLGDTPHGGADEQHP